MIALHGWLVVSLFFGSADVPQDAQAIARSADGSRLAVAWPLEKRMASRLRVSDTSGASEPREIELAGRVRALLFAKEAGLFVLTHRPAKRHEGEADLLWIDLASLETRDQVRLPPSTRALEHASSGSALLLACRDEIRTVLLPSLRSGPLFRVPGENLAMARIAGDRLLLGQERALCVVDLADPPGEYEMPLRARIEVPLPIVGIVLEGNDTALARQSDGTVLRVRLDPLSLDVQPSEGRSPSAPIPSAKTEVAAEELPRPVAASPDTPPPAPPAPPPSEAPQSIEAPRPIEPQRPGTEPVQALGTLVGADLTGVTVVLLGPDHLLREAQRVAVGPDGRWQAGGLAPGRYRVQLDGGQRAIVSDPPYRTIEILPDAPAVEADFRITGTP